MADVISIKPIGYVRNNVKEHRFGKFAEEFSEIVVNSDLAEGLQDIEDYSHVIVVYWMDRVKGYSLIHRPQDNQVVPYVGIFACRCPRRPNPIAITTVELLGVEGNKVRVKGLDVLDGSPVIDIKPYWPQYDEVKEAKVPDWVFKLQLD